MNKAAADTSSQYLIRVLMWFVLVVFMVVLWPLPFTTTPAHATTAAATTAAAIPLRNDEQVLAERALEFWQRLNDARRDPLAAAQRLHIPEESVRIVFSDQPWILEEGLPPLAWNNHLFFSAAGHGRDMFDRLFYSYVSPEGFTFDQRIAATGYEAQYTGEAINALVFENFVPLDKAFDLLVDSLLRDELSGNTAVQRNVFSSDITEMGVSFLAESIDLLGEQPFVYMFVADFASPLYPAPYLVGMLDADSRLAMRSALDGVWSFVPLPVPGVFQLLSPPSGTFLATVSENGLGPINNSITLTIDWQRQNQFIDLRTPAADGEE